MAKRKTKKDPFEVKLSEEKAKELTEFLAREINYAMTARMSIVGSDGWLDDAHAKYIGGDPNLTVDTPWPGAANLGSWIVTESVDAMRARIMATVFTDPIWVVEGFGQSAERAPIVEEFHQWKADQTKLAQFVGRAVHNSLIEGTGVLEVSDRTYMRKTVGRKKVQLQVDHETGLTTIGDDGQPVFVRDDKGNTVEPDDPNTPHAVIVGTSLVRASAGPSYRVLSLKDFYILPGHASERDEVWGYAKRFWLRLAELKCRERDGYYNNTEALGGPASSERMTGTGGVSDVDGMARRGQDIAPQQDEVTAEKEIWELTLLLDLDDDGYQEWYVVTFSATYRTILRVQYENYDTPSYILLVPFPRPNSVYGFSYSKDKLGSLYDEHSALRNMFADRMTLKTSAPMMQVEGSPWNPAERPFAPGEVLPVRDPNELKQLEIADVPQSVVAAMKEVIAAKERLSGMNDTTTGQLADANRTLGEVKLVTQQSWIRIDEVVKNLQQGFEDLFNILNSIWKNKLQDTPEPWPGDMMVSMQERAIQVGDQITADILDGSFRGKPRGSVEASDFSQMRADFVQLITAITQLSQTVPALKVQLNQPRTIRSLFSEIIRVYRWPDRASLLGTFTGENQTPQEPHADPMKMKQMELEQKDRDSERKSETALAVATLGGKFETLANAMQLFMDERARLGTPVGTGGAAPGGPNGAPGGQPPSPGGATPPAGDTHIHITAQPGGASGGSAAQ
jgi:hypothetical protein